LDIYTSRPFQQYKEHLNERCFEPYNRLLSFWEFRRTPTPIFGSVSGDLTLPSKWGCDNVVLPTRLFINYANTSINYVNTFIDHIDTSNNHASKFANYAHTSDDYANTSIQLINSIDTPTTNFYNN
jgi:hypothetical protein